MGAVFFETDDHLPHYMASHPRLSTYSLLSERQISPTDNNCVVRCITTTQTRPILSIIKIFKEYYLLSFDPAVPTITFTLKSTWIVNQQKGVQRQGLTESIHSYLLKCKIYQRKAEKYSLCNCLAGKKRLVQKIKIFKVLNLKHGESQNDKY